MEDSLQLPDDTQFINVQNLLSPEPLIKDSRENTPPHSLAYSNCKILMIKQPVSRTKWGIYKCGLLQPLRPTTQKGSTRQQGQGSFESITKIIRLITKRLSLIVHRDMKRRSLTRRSKYLPEDSVNLCLTKIKR